MAITLFLGGARSGKSRLAQRAAERCDGPLSYLATAEAGDGDMTERINRHRAERGIRWTTIDCPIALPEAIAGVKAGAILVDCLTLWLSNLLLAEKDIGAATDHLETTLLDSETPVILVSNEVGMGIVPDNALARRFRDQAGRLNQRMAEIADKSLFVIAGRTLELDRFG